MSCAGAQIRRDTATGPYSSSVMRPGSLPLGSRSRRPHRCLTTAKTHHRPAIHRQGACLAQRTLCRALRASTSFVLTLGRCGLSGLRLRIMAGPLPARSSAGYPPKTLQAILGHAGVTTMNPYGISTQRRGLRVMTCSYLSALGGTRTPNLLIRRSVHDVLPVRLHPYPQVRVRAVSS